MISEEMEVNWCIQIRLILAFFYKQRVFSTQTHRDITFKWIELQMLFKASESRAAFFIHTQQKNAESILQQILSFAPSTKIVAEIWQQTRRRWH